MRTILIVDDQPNNLEAIINYLKDFDPAPRILQARDGQTALRIAQERRPDLIISDWDMPIMNGIELVRRLKELEETTDIPVIMATGIMLSPEHLDTALGAGAIDYIRKPVDKIELKARVRSVLELSESYKEIKRQKERLEQLNEEKDNLMSIVAHDLKTPLAGIGGFVRLLKLDGNLDGDQTESVDMIGKSVSQGMRLIDDLLTISRIEAGQLAVNFLEIELEEAFEELKSRFVPLAENKQIDFSVNVYGNGQTIGLDYGYFQRITDNLISNALKFTKPGRKVWVTGEVAGEELYLTVADEGPGISEADQKKLFKKFQRLSATPTAGEASTGLGLSIVKAMVDHLGGEISVESKVGKGTTFTVALPIPEPAEA